MSFFILLINLNFYQPILTQRFLDMEDEKIKKSRKMIMYALIGLVITGLAYGVVDIVANLNLRSLQP